MNSRVPQIEAKIAELEALSAGHHARIRQNRQQGIPDSDPRTQKLLHEIQQVLNPRVLALRAERERWAPSTQSGSQISGRRSGIFVGDQPVPAANPYAGVKRGLREKPLASTAAAEKGQDSPAGQPPRSGPPAPRELLPNTVDPLTLQAIKPRVKVTRRLSSGLGDPGTPVTVEEDPNTAPWLGSAKAAGRLIPGVGAAIDGHERIYEHWFDALEAGVISRPPGLAPAGSAARQAQEGSLKRLRPLVEAYNQELLGNLRGRQMINAYPLDGALLNAPFERDLPNLYLENGKRWNWQDFGAYLRQHGVQQLSPWETKLLTSAINVRKIEWANQAATDQNIASEVALYVAGEIAGGLLAPVLLNRLARIRGVAKNWKPLQRLTETTEKAAPQVMRGTASVRRAGADSLSWAQTWARALAPNQENVRNAIANGLQEGLTYALTDPDPQADEAIRRALRGGSLGYLFQSGLHLGADGWKRLRGAYHRVGTRPQGELDRIFGAELQTWKTQAGHAEGAATRQKLGRTRAGTSPVEATLPNGRRGIPEPVPPPKGAQRGTDVTTAPAQQSGAVAVSGEPVFTAPVLRSLAEARKAAEARIAARQPRKAPARMLRGPKGMRPGAALGPDAWGAELGDLFDHAFIGATHLAEGVLNRAEWDLQMVAKAGVQIRPHLDRLWELAQQIYEGWKQGKIPTGGAEVAEEVKAYIRKTDTPAAQPVNPAQNPIATAPVQNSGAAAIGATTQSPPTPASPSGTVAAYRAGDRLTAQIGGHDVEAEFVSGTNRKAIVRLPNGKEQYVPWKHIRPAGKPLDRLGLQVPEVELDAMAQFHDDVLAGRVLQGKHHSYRVTDETEAAYLRRKTGLPVVAGTTHAVPDSDLRHLVKPKSTQRQQHLPITREDIRRIPEFTANADDVRRGIDDPQTGLPTIEYQKRVNGHVIYVEVLHEKPDRLLARSIRKVTADGDHPSGAANPPPASTVGSGSPPLRATPEGGVANTPGASLVHPTQIMDGSRQDVNSRLTTDTQSSPPREPGSGSDSSSKLSAGAVVVGTGLAVGQQKTSGGNDRGGTLLAKAVGARGSLQHDTYVDAAGKKRTAKWYVIGATPQGRAERELMAAHLQRRRPETAGRQWFIPGVGSGTLRELVVERGVVPAEVGNVYRQSPEQWRSGGGRSAKVGAR